MARFIQDPITHKLIPADEYQSRGSANDAGYHIQKSLDAFISPIDKTVISDRAQLRNHNKKHGVTNTADYGPDWFPRKNKERAAELTGQTRQNKKERIAAIRYAMSQHNQ